jgi:MarR family transcriptional regulator, lower aerobic nicotinate degradation pathway regulator
MVRARSPELEPDTVDRLGRLPTWLLSRASLRAHQLLTERLEREGMRGYHYRVLAVLAESGPISQADLGARARLDPSDVVAAVSVLAGEGFLVRTADPADRRRQVVSLTEAGRARLVELDRAVAAVQEAVLAPLTVRERQVFVALLMKLQP